MALKTTGEKAFRKYLLGDASREEQEAIELWLMSDDEAYDLLTASEDDLIDESLAGKLSGHELQQFNDHFLAAPERRRKLQFSRVFQQFAAVNRAASMEAPFWSSVAAFLSYRPAIGYAAAALIVLIIGGAVAGLRVVELQQRLDSATAQLAEAERQRGEFKRQLDQSQAQIQALEQTVADLKSPPAPGQPASETLLAYNLTPGLTRSPTDIPGIPLTGNIRIIRFTLTLLDSNYDHYRVALQDDGGQPLWTSDLLKATDTRDGKAVVVMAPVARIQSGTYSFKLSGISDSHPESVGVYPFRAVRQ